MALQASRPPLSPSPSLLLWPLMVLVPGGAAVGTEQSQVLPFPLVFWDFAFASLIRPFYDFDSCSRVWRDLARRGAVGISGRRPRLRRLSRKRRRHCLGAPLGSCIRIGASGSAGDAEGRREDAYLRPASVYTQNASLVCVDCWSL